MASLNRAFDQLRRFSLHANEPVHSMRFGGAASTFAMQLRGSRAKFEHFAGSKNPPTVPRGSSEQIDNRVERRGARIVSVIDDHESLLEAHHFAALIRR